MSREKLVGRLWAAVLAVTVAFVVSDYVRHPFTGGSVGRAAAPAEELTLVAPVSDDAAQLDARALASALSGPGRGARAVKTGKGAAATVVEFARRGEADGRRLLVLTSAMVAEIERGLAQPLSGSERALSDAAIRTLARLRPVGPLAKADAVVVTRARGGAESFAALAAGLRRHPGSRMIGIGADADSKARLAGLLSALRVDGEVPYRVFPTGADAIVALSGDDVGAVLTTRSQVRGGGREVRLLTPPRSLAGVEPAWSVVVGPPPLDAGVAAALARRISQALQRSAWRDHARRRALRVLRPSRGDLAGFLARERDAAARLSAIAATVHERRRPGT